MTPLIQEFVAMNPTDAVSHHWFDMTVAYKSEQAIDDAILAKPLPYPKTALVCAYDNKKVLFLISRTGQITGVAGLYIDGNSHKDIPAFMYIVNDEGVKVRHHDGTTFDYRTSSATRAIAFIATFLESLEKSTTIGYQPVRRANWEKKIRQGKVPSYDWTTVTIEPTKPKSDPQGGTHASPRWHERRGHWRTYKSGKKGWVKNCQVGDRALGAVFKDYKFQENV